MRAANNVLLGMSARSRNFMDRGIMNGSTIARAVAARRAAIGLLAATWSLLLWPGCVTTSKTPPTVPTAATPAVGSLAVVTHLTMLVESEPAGATVVVDGRPMGKTPLHLDVPATTLGFFRDYVEIRARFIADNKAEVSRTATEEFSPREKVPAVLHFTPAGARRTVR